MFATALFGATQDIVLDAYRRRDARGQRARCGQLVLHQRLPVSSLVPGSLAFVLADHCLGPLCSSWSRRSCSSAIVTMLVVPETTDDRMAPRSLRAAVVEPFREFFTRSGVDAALLILAFLFLYKLGDNMSVALQTPYLHRRRFFAVADRQQSRSSRSSARRSSRTAIGGLLMLRLPINKALWVFGVVQVTTSLGFAGARARRTRIRSCSPRLDELRIPRRGARHRRAHGVHRAADEPQLHGDAARAAHEPDCSAAAR